MEAENVIFSDSVRRALARLNVAPEDMIGEGGEGYVFRFGPEQVVKVYKGAAEGYLHSLAAFQARLAQAAPPFRTPRITEIGAVDGQLFTIEPRLEGQPMSRVVPGLSRDARQRLLANYLDALESLRLLTAEDLPFGQVLQMPETIIAPAWSDFLLRKMEERFGPWREQLAQDVEDFEARLNLFREQLAAVPPPERRHIVHGDYFPENVLVGEALEISAVIDFSAQAVIGDFRMDVAGAIGFLELLPIFTPEDARFLMERARLRYSDAILPACDLYRLFYSLYYADSIQYDGNLYRWCLRNLRQGLPAR